MVRNLPFGSYKVAEGDGIFSCFIAKSFYASYCATTFASIVTGSRSNSNGSSWLVKVVVVTINDGKSDS